MSKMDELDLCAGELRNAAQSLVMVADSLVSLFCSSGPDTAVEGPKATPPVVETKPIKLETVRAVLAEKSRSGYTAEVRALLESHGATRLSEIDPEEYPMLLKDAEALGNG